MKYINMKRFGSVAMAGALALSLSVPAFAEDTTNTSTNITGSYTEIPIAVDVPTTGTASINPYGLPVTLTKSDGKTVDLVGQQITTQPLSIKNQGTVKLDVDASLAVTPKGEVTIDTSADADKQITVNLEVAALNDETLALTPDAEKLPDLIIDAFANEDNWENAVTLAAPQATTANTAPAAPSKSNDGTNTSPMAVLGAVTPKSEGYAYGKNSIALFRLTGELAEEPNDGTNDNPWENTDGFEATVVFKFTPHADVAASVSLDKTTSALSTGSETLTAAFDAGDTDLTVTSYAWATSDATVANTNTTNTAATATVAYVGAGSATITVTATLSDGSTVSASCAYTNT